MSKAITPPMNDAWQFSQPGDEERIVNALLSVGFWQIQIPGCPSVFENGTPLALSAFLRESENSNRLFTRFNVPASYLSGLFQPETWKSIHTFAIVRNPWERLVSLHQLYCQQHKGQPDDFPTFVRGFREPVPGRAPWTWYGFYLGMRDFVCVGDEIVVSNIIRMEDPESGLEALTEDGELEEFLALNPSWFEQRRTLNYTDYYSDETRDIVATVFHRDIRSFGYSFGED